MVQARGHALPPAQSLSDRTVAGDGVPGPAKPTQNICREQPDYHRRRRGCNRVIVGVEHAGGQAPFVPSSVFTVATVTVAAAIFATSSVNRHLAFLARIVNFRRLNLVRGRSVRDGEPDTLDLQNFGRAVVALDESALPAARTAGQNDTALVGRIEVVNGIGVGSQSNRIGRARLGRAARQRCAVGASGDLPVRNRDRVEVSG